MVSTRRQYKLSILNMGPELPWYSPIEYLPHADILEWCWQTIVHTRIVPSWLQLRNGASQDVAKSQPYPFHKQKILPLLCFLLSKILPFRRQRPLQSHIMDDSSVMDTTASTSSEMEVEELKPIVFKSWTTPDMCLNVFGV